jgi:hypothetical protein
MADQPVKKSPWAKFGKALHIAVVVAFFLPFFGVSCSDKDMPGESIDIITISTTDMAFGCEPGGMISEAKNNKDMGGMMGDDDLKLEKVAIEPLAIIALLAAVGGVLAAFLLKGRKAVMGSLIATVLCLGAVVGIALKVGGEIDSAITDKMKADMEKSSMTRDSKIESGFRMGFWISLACLTACGALAGLSLKNRDSELPDVVPPPMGGGLPPV